MKQFACGDVVPGCDARFVATTQDEILAEVATHAAAAHGMASVPQPIVDQVVSKIQVVA